MKKIIIFLICVFVITTFALSIECQDVFVKIKKIDGAKTVSVNKEPATVSGEKDRKVQEKKVRIVLKNNSNSSIYHKKISIQGSTVDIYYGKNFNNKSEKKKVELTLSSKWFNKSNIVKVESSDGLKWLGHNEENGSPKYNGIFYVYKEKKGLVIVNEISMNDYISAVISSEIGTAAPVEALKAQAVCARTYILKARAKEYRKYDANGDDSTDFQVYNRIPANNRCKKASKSTEGVVMTYNNKLINAYYFSTSCGYTTDYRIWGKEKKSYLKSCNLTENNKINVKKNFDSFIKAKVEGIEKNYPYYRWNVELTAEQINNSIYRATSVAPGKIKKIEINSRGEGGIASQITVYGETKQIIIKNQNEIRKALCSPYAKIYLNDGTVRSGCLMLPSAFIHIEKSNGNYKIFGGGFGHGSGMSQNAAIKMAKQGKNYKEILCKFYHDIDIK